MAQQGFIKLHRCILDSSWSRQSDYVAVWVYCLLRANYVAADVPTKGGTIVHLEPGQFITSREQISIQTGVQQSKVERILRVFRVEQQIEQQNRGKFRVISIVNWQKYQAREHQDEQQMNNKRTTDEQQMNTDKKVKKEKKTSSALERRRQEGFEELYNDYPRKEGKKEALRHYNASVKTLEDMVKIDLALAEYQKLVKGKERQYIKQASSWFNNWQDYVPGDWEPAYQEAKAAWEAENEDNEREEDGLGADDQGIL